jgi:hypothetical protein
MELQGRCVEENNGTPSGGSGPSGACETVWLFGPTFGLLAGYKCLLIEAASYRSAGPGTC